VKLPARSGEAHTGHNAYRLASGFLAVRDRGFGEPKRLSKFLVAFPFEELLLAFSSESRFITVTF
jgi:hypothetical protein